MMMMRITRRMLVLMALVVFSLPAAQAQEVPPAVQQQLQQYGVSVAEARAMAARQGYDLNDPDQAAAFAREMGVPEAQIQAFLEEMRSRGGQTSQMDETLEDSLEEARDDSLDAVLDSAMVEQELIREEAIQARREAIEARLQRAEKEELPYFGYDIFEGAADAFQPGEVASVDDAYIVGPEDELRLAVWGAAEFQETLPVDREGRIYVPNVGQFTVAGRRLSDLREDLRIWLAQSYSGLVGEPPSVYMDVTLARLRPIQVFILGEVARPGGYVLPSNATVFNALYAVGGPMLRGSLRAVDIIRGGRPVATVDLYDYILKGYTEVEVRLQTNDRILVRPRLNTIAIRGQVRREAIYELQPGETFEDLLAYAGGLEADAYTRQFQVERIIPFAQRTDPSVARTVLDLSLRNVLAGEERVELVDGDEVTIYSIATADNLAARAQIPVVKVDGAVFKPGQYELTAQVRTVSDLIERADGLTGDAYRDKAELIRLRADLEPEVISLDIDRVLAGVPTQDLVLRPQDELVIYSELELKKNRTVAISGQVLNPGEYMWLDNMTVGDLLFKGGGLSDPEFRKDVFLMRADLYRRSADGATEEIIPFDLAAALDGEGMADEVLRPEDEIRVYPAAVKRITDREVHISGAVKAGGEFRYRDNMTLEDLILQANGFTEDAYLAEVEVTRMRLDGRTGEERAISIEVPLLPGVTATPDAAVSFAIADTALAEAREFRLQHRDRVYVRQRPDFEELAVVSIMGEVQFPGEYTLLSDNETLSDVLERAGGVRPTGYLGGGRLLRDDEQVIIQMDKAVRGSSKYDVILQPGDEVIIPATPNTVALRGNVANEGLIKFESGRRVSYYLDRAGGALDETEAIYLTQPSGATFKVKSGWFRTTPVVADGATINVTRKPPEEKEPFDLGKTITDTMAIVSSAVTILVVAARAFN